MQASAKTLARRQIERQIIEDGTAVWKTKKEIEAILAAEEKKQFWCGNLRSICGFCQQQWIMLATYNPWGKPGHGAPVPGALRKTKWTTDGAHYENDESSAVTLGRPGHGAPLRTPSGKTKALIKADPLIRFQLHDSARRAVENELRYRSTPNDKVSYRKQLDAIICEKNKKRSEEATPETPYEKKKGWTNNSIINRMARVPPNEREQMYEITGGGVELVPLLAKHRMVTRCPLSTTDVTRISRICNDPPKSTGPEYCRHLCNQINEKERQKQIEQQEDMLKSQEHFDTWKRFWGRPGHGAPRGLSQREKLEYLLYRIPFRRITSGTTKSP